MVDFLKIYDSGERWRLANGVGGGGDEKLFAKPNALKTLVLDNNYSPLINWNFGSPVDRGVSGAKVMPLVMSGTG